MYVGSHVMEDNQMGAAGGEQNEPLPLVLHKNPP